VKVYLGFECHYNGCDVFESVERVFDDETKALVWKEEFEPDEWEWRKYTEFEVE
jgi:hypothetical protein